MALESYFAIRITFKWSLNSPPPSFWMIDIRGKCFTASTTRLYSLEMEHTFFTSVQPYERIGKELIFAVGLYLKSKYRIKVPLTFCPNWFRPKSEQRMKKIWWFNLRTKCVHKIDVKTITSKWPGIELRPTCDLSWSKERGSLWPMKARIYPSGKLLCLWTNKKIETVYKGQ